MIRIPGLVVPLLLASFVSYYVLVSIDATASATHVVLSCITGFLSWYYIFLSFICGCREMFISDSNDDEEEVGDVTTDELIREFKEIIHYYRESHDSRAFS